MAPPRVVITVRTTPEERATAHDALTERDLDTQRYLAGALAFLVADPDAAVGALLPYLPPKGEPGRPRRKT